MIKTFRKWINDTLGFSKTEANGLLVLVVLILFFAILPRIYFLKYNSVTESFPNDHKNFNKWRKEVHSAIRSEKPVHKSPSKNQESIRKPESFVFNPNTATLSQLIQLGFKDKTAHNIVAYRKNGGNFRIKSDLDKIYGISKTRLSELHSFIDLPESYKKPDKNHVDENSSREKSTELVTFELNKGNAEDFQKINGIGPVLSERIVKFRDNLGGFYSKEQLYEVYGLDSVVVQKLMELTHLEKIISKININTDSLKELYRHPYINYQTAKVIRSYKDQHGAYVAVSEVKDIKIISDSLYQKIYPYLSINP